MSETTLHPVISISEITRPTYLEINLGILKQNFEKIKAYSSPAKIMAIVKANAYGHGLIKVAQLYQSLEVDYFGVAVLEEGLLLRENGITKPILVLGGILSDQIPLFIKNDLTLTASSPSKLEQIDAIAAGLKTKAKVHLKIDTGMERIGVHYYSAESFLSSALKMKNLIVEGIYSHFANSDSADLTHAKLQLERFEDVLSFFDKHSLARPLRHISNSGGILQLPEARFDMVRPGILLYGVLPGNEVKKSIDVKPALNWKSRVVYFKVIKPGHPVGYGSTWQTDHNIRTVTVPVGYGDGYFRKLSNRSEVILNGKRYPEIGTISMDQIIVNIENDSAYNSDEVILLGTDGRNVITCEEMADWAETIPYEILTNINTRVPRVYID
jgi:alanine racemase